MLFLLILMTAVIDAQNIITLKECYEKAYAATPVATENEIYDNIWQIKDKNLSKGWLPEIDAQGSFVYNSSVVDMADVIGSLPLPGIDDHIRPLPNEQYKVTLGINQMIYDGGSVKNARAVEKVDLNINKKQVEADLYKLREQINSLYFKIMQLNSQKELWQNYMETINRRIVSLNSALENGAILKSDIDVLTSEKIRLEQQLTENGIMKESLLNILSDITGNEIEPSAQFVIPAINTDFTDELTRPELEIFDLKKNQLDASLQLLQSKRMPKAFGFATFGYGNPPGSNFFRDEFAPYSILGAGISWNIFDWNTIKNEKQIIYHQQNLIDSRKSDAEDNLKRLLNAKHAEINSLKSLIETDSELIEIRKRITVTAESQYKNGIITATDYLNELNSEKLVWINYEIHKIDLAKAIVEFMNISGKEIN
ncbi:MAG: TolC family protein [Prolixibacteraceae bacterium]|nr:TolC family protein [Prolixibacteraceae bacterium]